MKTLLVLTVTFLFAVDIYAQDVAISSAGIHGEGDDRHILLIVKNIGKKPLKNVRVSCTLTLKMNIKGKESETEMPRIFDISLLAQGKTMEYKAGVNRAVLQCQKVDKIEVLQR